MMIEVDTPTNGNLMFSPVGRLIRGRFVAMRVKLEENGKLYSQWAASEGVIPGQRIAVDAAKGIGLILEPLRESQHAATRRKVLSLMQDNPHPREYDADARPEGRFEDEDDPAEAAKLSDGLPRSREVFTLTPSDVDSHPAETWAYWMCRAVKSGAAKLISGTFPDAFPHARRSFTGPRGVDPRDAAVKTLADQLALLTKIVLAKMTPAERKAIEEMSKAS